ncbi:MAG TPA: ABC transporter substrate-binding protein, partial [Bacillota bacterium]
EALGGIKVRARSMRSTLAAAAAAALLLLTACGGGQPAEAPQGGTGGDTGGTSPGAEAPGDAASGEPIKIGMLVEQTGYFSWYGEETLNGATLFVEELNAAGGINGRPIELVVYNYESDSEQAVNGARRLIQQDNVVALVGLGIVGAAQAVQPLVENGPLTYSLSGAYNPGHRYMFAGTVFVGHTQQRALQFLAEKGIKRVALLLTNDATGQIADQALHAGAANLGIEIVSNQSFNPDDVDVTAQLNTIRAANPEAIISWVIGRPLGVVLQGAKQLGITLPIITSHGNLTPDFMASLSELQSGPIYVFGTKDLIWRDVPEDDPQYEAIRSMQERHQQRFGKEGGIGTGTGYDALMVLAKAIEESGSTDSDVLIETIEGFKNLVGVVGIYNFSPDDHRGLDVQASIPMVLENGVLKAAD